MVRKQEARVEPAVTERRLSSNQRPGLATAPTNQRTGVEAEILRNINLEEPEIIDSLRPQPSILSTVIDGNTFLTSHWSNICYYLFILSLLTIDMKY